MKEILNTLSSKTGSGGTSGQTSTPEKPLEVIKEEEISLEDVGEPLLTIGVPTELDPDERRVALTPSTVKKFRKLRFKLIVESGAGLAAGFRDTDYSSQGAEIVNRSDVWDSSDIVLKVKSVGTWEECNELDLLDKV
ncbi:MAG: hypothetical protein V2I33_21225 [Kangiellaceae bacterium]|nr:hypothetical protein [Kangiellaceae bacterium]